jgi:hypothetical protein
MKLLLENWRKYLNEEHAKPAGADFKINHNLFVDYMNNNPDYQAFMKTNPSDHKQNQKIHQEYKWDFPHDVDISSDDCRSKLLYLDQLVRSFLRDPSFDNIPQGPENIAEKVSIGSDDSPYRKCREKSDIESMKLRDQEKIETEIGSLYEKK